MDNCKQMTVMISKQKTAMINKLLMFFRSPYPALMERWKIVLVPPFIIFIILWMLQPFGISLIGKHKFWILLGYGVVSSMALGVFVYLLPVLFPRYYDERRWTFGKELLGTLGACLLISVGNWGYKAWWLGSGFLGGRDLLVCMVWTGILAPFPIVFFLMWNRNLLLARNLREAMEMNVALSQKTGLWKERGEAEAGTSETGEEEAEVLETGEADKGNAACPMMEKKPVRLLLFSGGTKERLEMRADGLLYVEAEGNYVRIAYRDGNNVRQRLLRATMKQAEETVADCPFIVRCHRAFLVNVNAVVKVDGNSQGYRLLLEGCKEEVPVSRAYAKGVKSRIEERGTECIERCR